ncbi:response regulator [Sphingobacterium sp. HJSM2_6]|uniref:response regulator n=1 Tax=Sphingobacterium sp. HJSM2_6 TaxID=3366264 RepID=UPI003BD7350C
MRNILIIESDETLLNKYSDILKLSGYNVISTHNSQKGIELAMNILPSLILCNISIPDLHGFEVLSILLNNPLTSSIPFVFLNSTSSNEVVKKGLELGADDFITKPFQSNQLIRSVEARINKAKNQKWKSLPINESYNITSNFDKGFEELFELISKSKIRHLKKKQTLFYESDYSQWIYLLVEGSIKTYKLTNDGRQLITGLYTSKSFIGVGTLFLEEPLTESAEAVKNTSVYFLLKSDISELLNKHVQLNKYFMILLSNFLQEKDEQLVELAYNSVRKKLAQVLIKLSKTSVPIDDIDISRDELAGLAGIANETVSRILTDFKEKGLIERNGSQIQILDYNGLLNIKS